MTSKKKRIDSGIMLDLPCEGKDAEEYGQACLPDGITEDFSYPRYQNIQENNHYSTNSYMPNTLIENPETQDLRSEQYDNRYMNGTNHMKSLEDCTSASVQQSQRSECDMERDDRSFSQNGSQPMNLDCTENVKLASNNVVFSHLDTILRDKINLELDEFHGSIDSILENHQLQVARLLELSQMAKAENSPSLVNGIGSTLLTHTNDFGKSRTDTKDLPEPESENNAKMKCALELFTQLSIISNVLQQPAYRADT